jgi:small subunit ribosomal protein S27Ae
MHIQVNTITGKSVQVSLNAEDSVQSLYQQVCFLIGVPVEEQKLLSQGKLLIDGSLHQNQLQDGSQIYLVVDLLGGAKGKKKKKDTKKAKKKHKKKKVKLAILKYYKVEGDKVVRLRQMCKVCPPGTFLAEHPDRLYCGRCHTAYQKVGGADKAKGGKADAGKGKGKK